MQDERKELVKGVVVAAVTAATEDFDVDYDKLRSQYRFIVEGGITPDVGLVLAVGGGGEGYFLNDEQYAKSVKIFAEEAKGKATTAVGIFELSAKHAVEKILYAQELGIDFVQVAPPHYEKPTDSEVFDYYKMIDDAVGKIGVLVYHTYWAVPEYYEMTPPIVGRLADLKSIVGLKWASIPMSNFTDVLFEYKDRFAFVDNQGWVSTVRHAHGLDAFMFFGGNFDPPLAADLARKFLAGDYDGYAEGAKTGLACRPPLNKAILEEVHGPNSPERKTLGEGTLAKATMDLYGRPMGPAFPPQHNLSEAAKSRIKGELGLT